MRSRSAPRVAGALIEVLLATSHQHVAEGLAYAVPLSRNDRVVRLTQAACLASRILLGRYEVEFALKDAEC